MSKFEMEVYNAKLNNYPTELSCANCAAFSVRLIFSYIHPKFRIGREANVVALESTNIFDKEVDFKKNTSKKYYPQYYHPSNANWRRKTLICMANLSSKDAITLQKHFLESSELYEILDACMRKLAESKWAHN